MTVCHRKLEMTVCHRKSEMTASIFPEKCHILKMKKTISKKNHILKMKAHSETRFENEHMFFEKWLILNLKWRCATKNLKCPCATENLRWPCATKIQNDPVPQKIWNDRFNFSGNLSHFKNENTFRQITTFWKWKLILKLVLKMNAYFLKSD